MLVLPVLMCLLLLRVSNCSPGQGCMQWDLSGEDVCCISCRPGNYLVSECGEDPSTLCAPCRPNMFAPSQTADKCQHCNQCIDPQVTVSSCTNSTDTVCRCKKGFLCGNQQCSFCVEECGKGQEPTSDRSCRPCPPGTFNDRTHQKCKAWTRCPNQIMEKHGDAFSDSKCGNVSVLPVAIQEKNEPRPDQTSGGLSVILFSAFGTAVFVLLIVVMFMTLAQAKHKKATEPRTSEETVTKIPIPYTPTDDPATLRAVECSFHEAEQEQGSSSESLLP
ncbi:tumor necrosis factor receptor superfamily member 9a [Periophthalmus magnuspinnatus]|uniref:tumor necrosis factor receptor superfamily member 9a n=1 Tax=Periophthalmus magnuspinnatus TaxID=409849 RepID=UPI00145AC680|nr:tumor necrosis factor receptor superfamily member 9a [Periophthalmus magnuspinnatus]